jgi:hypothetical protein
MNTLLISISAMSALVLTSTAISLFALYRSHLLVRGVNRRHGEPAEKNRGDIQELRAAVEALAAQVYERQKDPPTTPPLPALTRPGLNLNKRSQALRMHRKGEDAARIAALLEVPRQEVELLLKVHRIVLSNV